MILNNPLINFIILIGLTIIEIMSEEITVIMTILALVLQLFQEVRNLNLIPSELLRRQYLNVNFCDIVFVRHYDSIMGAGYKNSTFAK